MNYEQDLLTLEQVNGMSGRAVLEFGTPWCGHCLAAMPAVQEAMAGYADLSHFRIYDGRGRRLGRAFRVKFWPTLVLLQDGREVARLVRPVGAEEVRRFLAESD